MMPLDRGDLFGRHAALRQADGAKAAVLLVPPGAPGDLRHFRHQQAAQTTPVDFLQPGDGGIGDVEVEPHSAGIRGVQIVNRARLETRELSVSGARWKSGRASCREKEGQDVSIMVVAVYL